MRDMFMLVANETETSREVWYVYAAPHRVTVQQAGPQTRKTKRHKWAWSAYEMIHDPVNVLGHRGKKVDLPARLVPILAKAMHAEVDAYIAKLAAP